MNKLNFGCGSIQPEGWWNVDKDESFQQNKPGTPYTLQTTEKFSDNFFDIIVAHAVVQQFEWHEMVDQLKELYRILKPGGVIRISLPDIDAGYHALADDDRKWFPNTDEKTIEDAFCAWLTWYSTSKTLLTPMALANKLGEAGFEKVLSASFNTTNSVKHYPWITELDTRENEFCFVEAMK